MKKVIPVEEAGISIVYVKFSARYQLKFRTSEYDAGSLGFIVSELITVSFELRSETELRNRLLFDAGLYMGLGVSLIFGGIHEALKIAMESKRK